MEAKKIKLDETAISESLAVLMLFFTEIFSLLVEQTYTTCNTWTDKPDLVPTA
jgi:hypothetical protein